MIPFRYWPIVLIRNTLHGCWVENGQIVPWKMGKWSAVFFQIEHSPTIFETNIGCYIRFALFGIILALCVIHTITIICCSDFFSWDSIFGHPSNFSRRQTFQKMHRADLSNHRARWSLKNWPFGRGLLIKSIVVTLEVLFRHNRLLCVIDLFIYTSFGGKFWITYLISNCPSI